MDHPPDAPESCPGTSSNAAGKAAPCQGCPNQSICASGATQRPQDDPSLPQIRARMASVRHKILVLSGKGGVGKSTVACSLAQMLAHLYPDKQIALLDVDICGPSVPLMMGCFHEQVHQSASGWSPIFVENNLCVMSVGFLLSSADDAVIWRGPRKNGLIKQFLRDVDWGDIDYMVIDCPPGTSDEHLSIVQYLRAAGGMDGALLVTTPQEVALADVRKELNFCQKVNLPVLGVIENMVWFICPKCSGENEIFPATTGGAAQLSQHWSDAHVLVRLPLEPSITRHCDEGKSIIELMLQGDVSSPYLEEMKKLSNGIVNRFTNDGKSCLENV